MSTVKTYQIDGVTYEQRELVLAQWRQLSPLLEGLEVPPGADLAKAFVRGLEKHGRLDRALAVVLTPQGESLQEKDIDGLEACIAQHITPAQIAEVINDFFLCNPISCVLERLAQPLRDLLIGVMAAMQTGLKHAASCSLGETGPEESASSGTPRPEKSAPGSSTASVN